MKYVLLYVILTGSTATSGSIEFNDKVLCEAAAEAVEKGVQRQGRWVYTFCFPKGVKL